MAGSADSVHPEAMWLALTLALTLGAGPAPDPAGARSSTLTIALGGDVALPAGPNDAALDALGPAVFEHLRPLLASADLAFANLESPLTERAPTVTKAFPMTTPPRRLDWILGAGLDLVSLANNHLGDAGHDGVADTLAALTAARDAHPDLPLGWAGAALDPRGAGDGVVVTAPGSGLRVGLLAFGNGSTREVAHLADRADVLRRVRAFAARTDVLLVSLHGGSEYRHAPDPELAGLARAIADAGAALVVTTHAHVVRGFERRGRALICHGLGNLAFATLTERAHEHGVTLWGALPIATFTDGRLTSVRVVPLWEDNAYPLELPGLELAPPAALAPYPLTGAHADAALDFLERLSRDIDPSFALERDGAVGVIRFE